MTETLQNILTEIGNAELKVTVQEGVIVSIPKQRIDCKKKFGVKKEVVIDEVIQVRSE